MWTLSMNVEKKYRLKMRRKLEKKNVDPPSRGWAASRGPGSTAGRSTTSGVNGAAHGPTGSQCSAAPAADGAVALVPERDHALHGRPRGLRLAHGLAPAREGTARARAVPHREPRPGPARWAAACTRQHTRKRAETNASGSSPGEDGRTSTDTMGGDTGHVEGPLTGRWILTVRDCLGTVAPKTRVLGSHITWGVV